MVQKNKKQGTEKKTNHKRLQSMIYTPGNEISLVKILMHRLDKKDESPPLQITNHKRRKTMLIGNEKNQ